MNIEDITKMTELIGVQLPETVIILRLFVAAILGSLIGLEREYHGQPAGLRTHIILCLGASFVMCLSINSSYYGTNGDVERLAAQVVSGVGFLGAGAIFKYGGGVRGLTTAASIWTTAAIGMSCGSGLFISALAGTLILLFTLIVLNRVEKRFIRERTNRTIVIKGIDHYCFVEEIKNSLKEFKISLKNISFAKNIHDNTIEVKAIIQTANDQDMDKIIANVQKIKGVEFISCNTDIV